MGEPTDKQPASMPEEPKRAGMVRLLAFVAGTIALLVMLDVALVSALDARGSSMMAKVILIGGGNGLFFAAAGLVLGRALPGTPHVARPRRQVLLLSLLTTITLVGASLLLGEVAMRLGQVESSVLGELSSVLAHASPAERLLSLIALAALPAVGEELYFRGFVLQGLTPHAPRWLAVTASSAAFGLVHLDLVQGTLAAILGLGLASVTLAARSIIPAMVAHFVNNALFVAGVGSQPSATDGDNRVLALALVLTALGASAFVAFARARKDDSAKP